MSSEYMFGPDFLVAPVMAPGLTERTVYLPLGSLWQEEETGTTFEGGSTVTAKAPLDVIPLFRRRTL